MSSYTSLSDHCNSIPSSRSVNVWSILNHFWTISCIVSFVSALLSKMFDVGDLGLPVLTSGNWVIKGWLTISGLWNYAHVLTFFNVFFQNPKKHDFTFFELLHTFCRTLEATAAHQTINKRMTGRHNATYKLRYDAWRHKPWFSNCTPCHHGDGVVTMVTWSYVTSSRHSAR